MRTTLLIVGVGDLISKRAKSLKALFVQKEKTYEDHVLLACSRPAASIAVSAVCHEGKEIMVNISHEYKTGYTEDVTAYMTVDKAKELLHVLSRAIERAEI